MDQQGKLRVIAAITGLGFSKKSKNFPVRPTMSQCNIFRQANEKRNSFCHRNIISIIRLVPIDLGLVAVDTTIASSTNIKYNNNNSTQLNEPLCCKTPLRQCQSVRSRTKEVAVRIREGSTARNICETIISSVVVPPDRYNVSFKTIDCVYENRL